MSVWKSFCRKIESKAVRRHFGDLVPLIETSAVFEFTNEQLKAAETMDHDGAMPPLPFPRVCCVGPGGVVVLREPIMNEATMVLTCEAMIGYARDGFVVGRCAIGADGELEVSETRGVIPTREGPRYFDDETPLFDAPPDDVDWLGPRFRAAIAAAEASGKDRRAAELRGGLDEAELRDQELASANEAVRVECDKLNEELPGLTRREVHTHFSNALKHVRWINEPDHYTVELAPSAPPRKAKKAKRPRITRLAERPRHIVLTKSEIETEWRRVHAGVTHASPIPHLRRGHYRTLKPRGTKDSRRVWVRAAHINGSCVEWRDGDVRYRVV